MTVMSTFPVVPRLELIPKVARWLNFETKKSQFEILDGLRMETVGIHIWPVGN
jgi:hypothetical protein